MLTPSACRRSAARWSFGDLGFGDFFFLHAAPLADLGLVLLLDRLPHLADQLDVVDQKSEHLALVAAAPDPLHEQDRASRARCSR